MGCGISFFLGGCSSGLNILSGLLISFIAAVDGGPQYVESPKVPVNFSTGLRKFEPHGRVPSIGVASEMCEDQMCMSEEKKVCLFIITFSFVDVCLRQEHMLTSYSRTNWCLPASLTSVLAVLSQYRM